MQAMEADDSDENHRQPQRIPNVAAILTGFDLATCCIEFPISATLFLSGSHVSLL